MSNLGDNEQLKRQVEDALRSARTFSEVLVGTLIERLGVKLRECQGFRADALLACLEAIRRAALRSPHIGRLNRVMRLDGSIDLWITMPGDASRSAVFTLQVDGGFDDRDLVLMLGVYVPFGADGDQSEYPVELSTAYVRDTQELRAVVNLQAKRTVRSTMHTSDADETARSTVSAREEASRASVNHSSTYGERQADNSSRNSDRTTQEPQQTWFSKTTTTERNGNTSERVVEQRAEQSQSQGRENCRTERDQSERSSRSGSRREQDTVTEVTQDVSFVAVGTDFTSPEKLWTAWRAAPGNAEIGSLIELVLMSLPALGEATEEGVSSVRRSSRIGGSAPLGNELSPEFLSRAERLIPVSRSGMWPRKLLSRDGRARPIGAADIQAALQACKPGLASASETARGLFG